MANERFLSYASELVFGTLPTTGWLRSAVITSSGVSLNRDSVESEAISGNRGTTNIRAGNDNITGGVDIELAVEGLEFFLYHTLGRAWTEIDTPVDTTGTTRTASAASAGDTNILVDATAAGALSVNDWIRIGVVTPAGSEDSFVRQVTGVDATGGTENIDVDHPVPRDVVASEPIFTGTDPSTTPVVHEFTRSILPVGFSLQHNFEDITQFYKYSGLRVNNMSISVPTTGLATASVDLRGKTSVRAASATGGALTAVEVTPYISYEAAVQENAISFGDMLEFNMTFNNDLDDNIYVLGSRERAQLPEQRGSLDGTVSMLFTDETIADKFRNETESSIKLTFTNGTNILDIFLPRVLYTGGAGDPGFQNAFGPVTLEGLPFQAIVDQTLGTDIVVTVTNSQHIFN